MNKISASLSNLIPNGLSQKARNHIEANSLSELAKMILATACNTYGHTYVYTCTYVHDPVIRGLLVILYFFGHTVTIFLFIE